MFSILGTAYSALGLRHLAEPDADPNTVLHASTDGETAACGHPLDTVTAGRFAPACPHCPQGHF